MPGHRAGHFVFAFSQRQNGGRDYSAMTKQK
jgi:hypothetical protein